ncbi:MAG: hypothetical protein KDB00_17805 [Planctomycetales bacterium]|nr:hypothetical protein [Planctomycetales bacterium]
MNVGWNLSVADLWTLLILQTIQVTLLVGVVMTLVRFFAKNRPHLAHALWTLVLLKCVTPPIFALPISPFSALQPSVESGVVITTASTSGPDIGLVMPRSLDSIKMAPIVDGDSRLDQVDRQSAGPQIDSVASSPMSRVDEIGIVKITPQEGSIAWLRRQTSKWMVITWAGIAAMFLITAIARLAWFLRRVRLARVTAAKETQRLLDQLILDAPMPRLVFRRRVRIDVVDSLIGPAVVGLWRPRILLPRILESECSESELRILLAHELTHIRRGDLWWALLQTVACCVWWFHPLIRLVSRWFDRVTEMSCDEETVAVLQCRPAEYARGLLSVLERKHLLHTAPALPGVRPVDLTAKRMERIMKLSNGANARRPWWIVLVLLVGAICVLPGAAIGVADDKGLVVDDQTARSKVERDGEENWKPVAGPIPRISEQPNAKFEVQVLTIYDAKPAIEKIKAEEGCGSKQAEQILSSSLMMVLRSLPGTVGGNPAGLVVDGDRVLVRAKYSEHERIRKELERIEKHGFTDQVVVETKFATMPADKFSQIEFDWDMVPQSDSSLPVLIKMLDPGEARKLVETIQADSRANLLHAPKVTLFNGQEGKVTDLTQRPFVVGLGRKSNGESEPMIRVEDDGIEMSFCPVIHDRFIELEIGDSRSKIASVGTFSFMTGGKPQTVQVPKVAKRHFQNKISLPRGYCFVYVMPDESDWDNVSIVIIKATAVAEFNESKQSMDVSVPAVLKDVLADVVAIEPTRRQAEYNRTSEPQASSRVLIKCDGPRMSESAVAELSDAIGKFGWSTHLEGTFEYEINDTTVTLRGENLAISEDSDSMQLTSPRGEIVFDLSAERMNFKAESVLELSIGEFNFRLQGKELSLGEGGLNVTGSPVQFELKEQKIRGQSERLAWDDDLVFTGDVLLQAGDTRFEAEKICLTSNMQYVDIDGNARLERKVSGEKSSHQIDFTGSSLSYELKSGTLTQK